MKLVAVLCLLAAVAVQVYAMPNGAPSLACPTIRPGGPHLGTNPPNSANMSANPFRLDLSELVCTAPDAVGYCYTPGTTYTSKQAIVCHCCVHKIGIHLFAFFSSCMFVSCTMILQLLCQVRVRAVLVLSHSGGF